MASGSHVSDKTAPMIPAFAVHARYVGTMVDNSKNPLADMDPSVSCPQVARPVAYATAQVQRLNLAGKRRKAKGSKHVTASSIAQPVQFQNPFEHQLTTANLRLKRAQLALLKKPQGESERKALRVAQQAFCKAWQLSLSHLPVSFTRTPTTIPETSAIMSAIPTAVAEPLKSNMGKFRKQSKDTSRYQPEFPPDRRERNKISATKYRQKKKAYIQDLESRVVSLEQELTQIRASMVQLQTENAVLRSNLEFLRRILGNQEEVSSKCNSGPESTSSSSLPEVSDAPASSDIFGEEKNENDPQFGLNLGTLFNVNPSVPLSLPTPTMRFELQSSQFGRTEIEDEYNSGEKIKLELDVSMEG